MTDSFGRHVDFKNVILIMTSNIGAHRITMQEEFGFQKRDENVSYDKMKEVLKIELESYFRPEFMNRVDEMIVFHKLTHDDLIDIVDLELDKLALRLRDKGFELDVNAEAKDFLIENGTDEKFGARPLRRAIEHHLEDLLSEAMLRGDFEGKNMVEVTIKPTKDEDEDKQLQLTAVVVDSGEPEPVAAGQTDET